MDTSAIVSNAAEAWRRYVSIGAISPDLLRPEVFESWVRSHDHGASAWVARAEVLSPGETHRLLERHARLIAAARPYLHLLSEAAGAERHAMLLGTADAILLDVVGDEQSVSGPERVAAPGMLLSEAVCGANGVGTPIAAGRYVEVIATEHFIHGFHPFTCHGIPIVSPVGELEGVISASVRLPENAECMREILFCAARGIVSELARLELLDRMHAVVEAGQPDRAAIEALGRELVRLGVPPPRPAADAGGGDMAAMMALLAAADEAAQRFERERQAWRELATVDLAAATPVELGREVSELLALLRPDLRRGRVECTVEDGVRERRLVILADRHLLRRTLLRQLLRALEGADGGGALTIDVVFPSTERWCSLCLRSVPAPGSDRQRTASSMSWPLVPDA